MAKAIYLTMMFTLLMAGVATAASTDPTRPTGYSSNKGSGAPQTVQAPLTPLRIGAIFLSKKQPKVILNGQTVGIGEWIEGRRLIAIEATQITVLERGLLRTVPLSSNQIKRFRAPVKRSEGGS